MLITISKMSTSNQLRQSFKMDVTEPRKVKKQQVIKEKVKEEILYTFKDGSRIVNCLNLASLALENAIMKIGDASFAEHWLYMINNQGTQVWSLRDQKNRPDCIIFYESYTRSVSVLGYKNQGVAEQFKPYIEEWLLEAKRRGLLLSSATNYERD